MYITISSLKKDITNKYKDFMNLNWFELTKHEFQKYLKEIKATDCAFRYYENGNDPCNPCGTIKKQATYEFYVITNRAEKLIAYRQHRRTHSEVKEQLEKRYTRWAKELMSK